MKKYLIITIVTIVGVIIGQLIYTNQLKKNLVTTAYFDKVTKTMQDSINKGLINQMGLKDSLLVANKKLKTIINEIKQIKEHEKSSLLNFDTLKAENQAIYDELQTITKRNEPLYLKVLKLLKN